MKALGLTIAATVLMTSASALAVTAGKERIDECIADNADEGQTPEVVSKYCECMDKRMGESETATVSAWEDQAAHDADEDACDAEAGWVDDDEDEDE